MSVSQHAFGPLITNLHHNIMTFSPIIIIPQDVTRYDCHHIILDVGHIAVSSNLLSKDRLETIKAKQNREYTEDDYAQLESMMYDQFHVELTDTQVSRFVGVCRIADF